MEPVTTIVGWFLAPVISFAVTKALEYLGKPLKRASAYKAKLSKLEVLLLNITPLVAKVDDIKVVHQHQIKLRRKFTKAVLEADRDTLNFNGHYKQLLKLEEAEAAGKKSVVKRWQVFFSVLGLPRSLSKSINSWQRVERIANEFILKSDPQSTTALEGKELMAITNTYEDLTDDSERQDHILTHKRKQGREVVTIPNTYEDLTDDDDSERQDHILPHKRKRGTEAALPITNKRMKINDLKGKERAENVEGTNPIHRGRMDSQIVEFGRTPLEMCQYAKEVFNKSCPSPLREKYAQCQFEDIASRMTQVAFEVGVAAATLWQRCQELDLIFKGKVLPPQIEKDLEDDKNNKLEEGSTKD